MKKLILILATLTTMMASNIASAATAMPLPGDNYRITDCALLANDIKIVLTSNVIGGVECNTTGVGLSVCHTSGQNTSRSSVVTDPNITPSDANDDCDPATDAAGCVQTVTGASFPGANSYRGTVASTFPGANCDAASVQSEADLQAVAPQ